MKARLYIWVLPLLLALAACDATTLEARRMVKRAEQLTDTLPDSTVRLIDSVLRMPASFSERERMDMALLQAEALFGDHGQDISPVMDDDFFDDHDNISTSPELEHAAAYYAKKKQYDKAAHAALYSGFVQQHYDEKENAMRSFKEAEHYGNLANDSLYIALADYSIGKMLYTDFMTKETLSILTTANLCFGNRYTEKAIVQNSMASCCILLGDYDNAEYHLQLSLEYAEKGHSLIAKIKAQNNLAVLFRQKKEYDKALDCLEQAKTGSKTEIELVVLLNMAKVYMAQGEMDSTAIILQKVEESLNTVDIKKETLASAYSALALFSENQGDYKTTYQYRCHCDQILLDVMKSREQKGIYRIRQQYDYNTLKETMNKRIIHRQRIIMLLCIVAALIMVAFAISQINLAKIRKQEAEIKVSLLNFMQQNQELEHKSQVYENAYHDLKEYKSAYEECAHQLSDAWSKEQHTMQKLAVYLKNDKEDAALLGSLKQTVYGNYDYWEAMLRAFDKRYPGIRKKLIQQFYLSEIEQKVLILTYLDTSREDTSILLEISIHMVDKLRNNVRKKMQEMNFENEVKV